VAKVIWSEPALAQLESIVDFIALDKPEAARAVATRVFSATDQLESFIRLGRPIQEFDHKNYRQVWVKPCWIYYRTDGESIYILHVRRAEKLLKIEDLIADDK
jgi:plasmid stabilization system protein ParE